ncbi:hypothetical protein [Allobaculum sp. JKK-2023]|uniref:hypothetical protein n=1 Tax=Allobaculum sp. JKK-2023 TaxID=3108943 RepID=UPI002B054C89|nr:hypothetical protein [Allobaculum sp. JKK-2023]
MFNASVIDALTSIYGVTSTDCMAINGMVRQMDKQTVLLSIEYRGSRLSSVPIIGSSLFL